MMALELDRIFQGRPVPGWLQRFESEPAQALEDLLLGRAALGHLNADEPIEVLLDWLESLGERSEFPQQVDAVLAQWIENSWGRSSLPKTRSAAVLALAWVRAANLIAFEPRLARAAEQLRAFFPEQRSFLSALSEGRARDPEGRAWLAVARHQKDRSLLPEWWRLCNLAPDVPWYHGIYGIQGLRGLPAESAAREGAFPAEVAEGLARLASGLAKRYEEGWLELTTAREEFLRTARLTMSAYPTDRWLSFWRHTLQQSRIKEEEETARSWIQELFPQELKKIKEFSRSVLQRRWAEPDLAWPQIIKGIVAGILRRDPEVEEKARRVLGEQGRFAEITGDTYFVVRSACNLATHVRDYQPELALEWAELARRFDPWNTFAWNTTTASLLALGQLSEALKVAIGAVQRFPQDAVARTTLGEVLKAKRRYPEAEAVFREAVSRFPEDAVARTGLAQVLKAQRRYPEAEAVYRETVSRFPEDVVARNGLAQVLKAQSRLHETEAVYRETISRFPKDVVTRNGLAEVLKAQRRYSEAEAVYRDTVSRFPDNVVARNGLAQVLKAKSRLHEAEAIYRKTISQFPEDVFARNGLAEVLKARRRYAEAEAVYTETVSRFPEEVVARAGLAQVLKAQTRLPEAEAVYRETISQFPEDVVVRTGLAEVLKAQSRYPEAEAVYRETVSRFPENVVARNGLAEVLKAQGRYSEAEVDYRETVSQFPEDVVARNGLAEVLKAQDRYFEAEAVYRETVSRFSENVVARNGLAEVLKLQDRYPEADAIYRELESRFPQTVVEQPGLDDALITGRDEQAEKTPELSETDLRDRKSEEADPDSPEVTKISRSHLENLLLRTEDLEILLQDIYLLRNWASQMDRSLLMSTPEDLRELARGRLAELLASDKSTPELAGELGLLGVESQDLESTLGLLREAAKRYPGSMKVRYTLARAEREAAARRRQLDAENPESPVLPWRRLGRLDERLVPLQLLGEARTWLLQVDGSFLAERARISLGELAYRIQILKPVQSGDRLLANRSPNFLSWWASEIRCHVFGGLPVIRADDIEDLDSIRENLFRNAPVLNSLEEYYLGHWARA